MSRSSRLTAVGRGKNYSRRRGIAEAVFRRLYRGGWPGRLWGLLPQAARVQPLTYELRLLPPGTPPLRIAFASDLHFGSTTSMVTLNRACELLGQSRPDVLILGGDFVFLRPDKATLERISTWAGAIPATTKIAVFGNHDLWADHSRIEAALEAGGVRVLINDAVTLPPPHQRVALIGLDDPLTGIPDVERAYAKARDARLCIVACHSPDGLDHLRDQRPALYLCGHTHGGQIALPGSFPIIIPGPNGRRWPYGLYDVDGMKLFVSRGLGGVELPIRAFAPPDVSLLTLKGRKKRWDD